MKYVYPVFKWGPLISILDEDADDDVQYIEKQNNEESVNNDIEV